MLKTLLLVMAGLVAGFAIAFWLQSSSPPTFGAATPLPDAAPAARGPATDPRADERLVALEDALDAEILQRAALEERVAELAAELEALGQRERVARNGTGAVIRDPASAAGVGELRAREQAQRRAVEQQRERRLFEQLIAEGFPPDRAEWITRRTEELRMEALQAQYDAQRGGRPVEPGAAVATLRAELGDADYERYLKADGRPTAVPVRDVLASSPAEHSGLEPGDEIVAYGGRRVFDMRELNALTLEGTPGESVVVDVRRDGQTVQLVIPRGPIGILGGGFRGR